MREPQPLGGHGGFNHQGIGGTAILIGAGISGRHAVGRALQFRVHEEGEDGEVGHCRMGGRGRGGGLVTYGGVPGERNRIGSGPRYIQGDAIDQSRDVPVVKLPHLLHCEGRKRGNASVGSRDGESTNI